MKYDATYHSRYGKAITHIVAPPEINDEQKAQLLASFYTAAWAGWNALPVEKRLKINAEIMKNQTK